MIKNSGKIGLIFDKNATNRLFCLFICLSYSEVKTSRSFFSVSLSASNSIFDSALIHNITMNIYNTKVAIIIRIKNKNQWKGPWSVNIFPFIVNIVILAGRVYDSSLHTHTTPRSKIEYILQPEFTL